MDKTPTTRPDGFYWVRWWPDGKSGESIVEIAYWAKPGIEHFNHEDGWSLCGSDVPIKEGEYGIEALAAVAPHGR